MEKNIDENAECKPESYITMGGPFCKLLRTLLQHQFLYQLAIIALIFGCIYPVYNSVITMQNNIDDLKTETKLLRCAISKIESKMHDSDIDLQSTELKVKEKLRNMEDAVEKMKTDNELMKNKLGSIRYEINDVNIKLATAEEGRESTQKRVENSIEDLKSVNMSIRIVISNAEVEISDVKTKFYTVEEELQVNQRRFEKTVEDLKTEMKNLLTSKINKVESEIHDVRSNVHTVEESAKSHQSKVETNIKALNAEVTLLRNEISMKDPEFGAFKTKLQALKEDVNNLQLNDETTELKTEIMLLKSEISKVQPEIHDVKSTLFLVEEDLKSSQRQLDTLETKSTSSDTITKEFFINFTRTENELDKHTANIQHLLILTKNLKEESQRNINTLQVALQTRLAESACQSGYHIGRSDSRARIIFPFHMTIQFDPPFKDKPAFSYGLTYLHSMKHLSVNVELISLTEESFKLNFVSWGGDDLYGARISWIACPK